MNALWSRVIDDVHAHLLLQVVAKRDPDFIVGKGAAGGDYLRRWWLIPRNRLFNAYLHEFRRDDDTRALHDHMYFSISVILCGCYIEHTIAAGGVHRRRYFGRGRIIVRSPWAAHRIELHRRPADEERAPVWTLFITGPRIRNWGFHCPDGWVPWQRFTARGKPGETGRGCD